MSASILSTPAQTPPSSPSASTASPTGTPLPQQPQQTLRDRTLELWKEHQLPIILTSIALGGGLIGYVGVLWINPLWLLKIPSTDLPVPWTSWKVPLGVVRSLKYRNRVLDAWVSQHWQTAKTEFSRLPTVTERNIHIGLPAYLNQQLIEDLTGNALSAIFTKKPAVLLITGEGGAGKTSLACQIALWGLEKQLGSHRLLPVLVETELDEQRTLFEVIRGQLNALANQPDPIDPELLEKLLHRQRVLVIVDHLSEMSEATRKQVTPDLADFPAKALVVTSRLNESLGGIPKTILEPLRIEGSRLSRFMDAYLEQREKRDLFEDEDYFDACRRLSRMVGQRNITILLARLYADQMIEQQQGAGGTLPASVPELMLSYLNQLNRTIEPDNQRDYLEVQQDAQRIAWECLKHTYRPTTATKANAIAALEGQNNGQNSGQNSEDAQARLIYLETRLRLLQILEPGDKLRIVLDPLAEYLAALCLVDFCRENPEGYWQQFLNSIESVLEHTNDPPEAIQGFLLAVRDCCLLKQKEAQVPNQVPEILARKAGLDPEELRRIEEKRRIRLLISDLSAPELSYRIRAADDLGSRGTAAMAVPNLLGMVENPNQLIEARQAAMRALGNLGNCSEALRDNIAPRLIALLENNHDEPAVRRSAAEALGVMQVGKAELLNVLENDTAPLTLRQGSARALSLIGASSGEPMPMLIVELRAEQVNTQVKSIRVWKELLSQELTLDLVAVPGGDFLMGSPPDEVGRDWYPYNFPDTEGLDVEMQHRVTLPSFWMSRVPITQAQWRAIATLPKINQELNPDPSHFKGDRRPVENISWNEAVEFCDRLSQHTGKAYRLPSEAEWEYSCRAGTTEPFHFGGTVSTELANYNGNYTYGNRIIGEYRQKTTEVGSFGVVNAFGLSDMHGNVFEWCLDHWHPTYDSAPTDGSAWITDGDDRYRLMRGGSWYDNPEYCRSAFRSRPSQNYRYFSLGFRVVCFSPCTLQRQSW
ncbi:MAG: SUMF1/EgtB/PvdO family nonheme iron enzyme [Elainellaceae cyanobacterium]